MASLCVVFLAVLASVAAGPVTTTESTANTSLAEKRRLAEEGCKNISEQDMCHELCLLKGVRGVDDSGRYMESGAADFLAIGLPPQRRVEKSLKQAAKACNSMNDHIVEGCKRAQQISECLATEYKKATATAITASTSLAEKRRLAEEACKNITEPNICHELCLLKSVGGVDDSGRYMESGAADFLAIGLPPQRRVEESLKQAAKACNSVNDHIVAGCDRAQQISDCLTTEYNKETNKQG